MRKKQVLKSKDLIWMDTDNEIWISNNQCNENEFGDPVGDDDSNTTTNIHIFKETDLKAKLDPYNIKVYKEMKRLKS
jgi:hypothetical protein